MRGANWLGCAVTAVATERRRELERRLSTADARLWAFERFRRGADPRLQGGRGLGLYTVRTLATAHRGWAALREAPGGGLEAVVWLADLADRQRMGTTATPVDDAA